MAIKEYRIIPYSMILLFLIVPTWFNYGMWIKDFYVPYINFYVEDISDELIHLLLLLTIHDYLKSDETKRFVSIIFMYFIINCFSTFTDYIPIVETYHTFNGLLITYDYDMFDLSWIILKSSLILIGLIYFYIVLMTKYKLLNHKLN